MPPLAIHSLVDFHGCDPAQLTDADGLRAEMLAAVREAGGTVVTDVFHAFSPHGLSGVIVIAESHVALHTWPEHGYAAVDIFSCSPRLDQDRLTARLATWLKASTTAVDKRPRGTK